MPIKIPNNLPAKEILTNENIFVMDEDRAYHQDIRPLKIAILNLMPIKILTETQLLRLLGNTPLQVEIDLLHTSSYKSKNTPIEHLSAFYKTFKDVKKDKYDGFIITGAPVEQIKFEEVSYWEELKEIMSWSIRNVFSTFHICWAAQAGLYYHYNIGKRPMKKKIFGVFKHRINNKNFSLLRGFDDVFYMPHSRYTDIDRNEIIKENKLNILAESNEAGVCIIKSNGGRQVFVTGHPEYDRDTLEKEYMRDKEKGLDIDLPRNYFPEDNYNNIPLVNWRSHANILFSNWLNYYVYQETPYNLSEIKAY